MVLSCPQEYYDSVLCPLLGPMFAYMLQVRISLCCQFVSQKKVLSSQLLLLADFMACFCFLWQRLNVKWQVINQRTSVK